MSFMFSVIGVFVSVSGQNPHTVTPQTETPRKHLVGYVLNGYEGEGLVVGVPGGFLSGQVGGLA